MASSTTTFLRRLNLAGIGLTFLFIAGYVLFNIEKAAYLYGYTLNGVDGHNEFRAVYMGFWIGLTVLFFIAAWKIEVPILGDIPILGKAFSGTYESSERTELVFFLTPRVIQDAATEIKKLIDAAFE